MVRIRGPRITETVSEVRLNLIRVECAECISVTKKGKTGEVVAEAEIGNRSGREKEGGSWKKRKMNDGRISLHFPST